MTDTRDRAPHAVAEPRRQRVRRVVTRYAAIGFVVIIAASVILPRLAAPGWAVTLVIVLVGLGFLVAVGLAYGSHGTPAEVSKPGPPPGSLESPEPPRPPRPAAVAPVAAAPATSERHGIAARAGAPVAEVPVSSDRNGGTKGVDRCAIAVLPFENMNGDAEDEFFSDGIAEEISTALARLPDVRVAGRASAFSFKGQYQDPRSIGKQLNVDTVLEGRVERDGDRVRITTQLIDTNDGSPLWSERYDRDVHDIVIVQDEIARAIADRLTVEPGARSTGLTRKHADNPEAYRLYLKGRHLTAQLQEPGFSRAIEAYEEAIALVPDYALAYAALAECQILRAVVLDEPYAGSPTRARAAAQKALELNDAIAEAHAVLGVILTYYDLDWRGAERAFRRALELGADSAWMHIWYGDLLAATRRFGQAVEEARRAQELEPVSPLFRPNLVQNLWLHGRLDEAEKEAAVALQLFPELYVLHVFQGLIAWSRGSAEEAIAGIDRAIDLAGGYSAVVAFLTAACYHFGVQPRADELFEKVDQQAQRGQVSAALLALVHLCRRDNEAAIQSLRGGRDNRDPFYVMFRVCVEALRIPIDDSVRTELQRLGFP